MPAKLAQSSVESNSTSVADPKVKIKYHKAELGSDTSCFAFHVWVHGRWKGRCTSSNLSQTGVGVTCWNTVHAANITHRTIHEECIEYWPINMPYGAIFLHTPRLSQIQLVWREQDREFSRTYMHGLHATSKDLANNECLEGRQSFGCDQSGSTPVYYKHLFL